MWDLGSNWKDCVEKEGALEQMEKEMGISSIMFAAPKSGSGKTLLTCSFLQALCERGTKPVAFKCGPDYIDPMFHQKVLGVPSKNLDSFLTTKEVLQARFREAAQKGDIAVIEGAMGLYDGLGGIREEASAYEIAAITDTPIVMIVDARGMGRSVIPLIKGFLSYDTKKLIRGVILNKTSSMFYSSLKEQIEAEIEGIQVFGYVPMQQEIELKSRHLGLFLPDEIKDLKEQLTQMAAVLEECVDIDGIIACAKKRMEQAYEEQAYAVQTTRQLLKPLTIAIARDEAFCFYYEDNLKRLEECGAQLCYFSPIHDKTLPKGCAGLLLGGGYPELYLKELSENESMLESIRGAITDGMPSLAECGGFLYLHEQMADLEGVEYPLAGIIAGTAQNTKKLVRFGYVTLTAEKEGMLLPKGAQIRGHEFHYYDSTKNGDTCTAVKPVNGRSWNCMLGGTNYLWGFPHLSYDSNPELVSNFMHQAQKYKEQSIHNMAGKLSGVGVGPGDPELLTIKALQTIKNSDVIILPSEPKEDCYAYQIVKQVYPDIEKKEICALPFPMTKDKEMLKQSHEQIFRKIWNFLQQGKNVAFLTIGDATVYSTYTYIHTKVVNAGGRAVYINGVPSFCAVAATLGIPLAETSEEIHIIPGSYDIQESMQFAGTKVYMKSGKKLLELKEYLQKRQQNTISQQVWAVSNCGLPNQKICRGIEEITTENGYLTIVIVKE